MLHLRGSSAGGIEMDRPTMGSLSSQGAMNNETGAVVVAE